MKTPMKVSIKVQRTVGTLSRMRSRMSITFKCIISGQYHPWFFLQKGNIIFVTFINICRKYHKVSYSHYFLRKSIFHFSSIEKISYFPGKSFQIIQKTWYSSAMFFLERPSFRVIWRKYYISMFFLVFFDKDHLSFST